MARPTKARRICMEAAYDNFCPEGVPAGEKVIMTMDEYETIRLRTNNVRSRWALPAQR